MAWERGGHREAEPKGPGPKEATANRVRQPQPAGFFLAE